MVTSSSSKALRELEALPEVPSKAARVRDRLRSLIESGQLAPDDRLNIDAIARALGVSKIPVREAIKQLEAAGLVVVTPHAGARVAVQSAKDLRGLALIRSTLEPLSARLAAEKITPAQVAELEDIGQEMKVACREGRLAPMTDLNRAFHVGVARASGYRPIADMVEDILRRSGPYHRQLMGARTWGSALVEHAALLVALRRHDAVAAETVARNHVGRHLLEQPAEQPD